MMACSILTMRRFLHIAIITFYLFPVVAFLPLTHIHWQTSSMVSPLTTKMTLFPMGESKSNIPKEKLAQKAIDTVVATLRKDKLAQSELGNLLKVTNILGFGTPIPGKFAVRFNASFQRKGNGLNAKAMSFGLGQKNQSVERGVMVGQVKASVDSVTGRVLECTVFRDLGYGRSFNLNIPA